jgi:outer membrane autotransporter protein
MEFGVDVGITDTLRLGVLASKGDASVTAKGVGRSKINVDSYGAYVTWLADNGFYVDATYRKMDFSAEVKADGFKDKPDASADGYSLEAGYAWKLQSGLVLKPEFQYSAMNVSKFDVTDNSYGTFDLKDGDSTRLRAGLTVQKTLGDKGKTWTPYGGAYFVDEMDGKGTFSINSDFQGDVDIGGNSVLIEGGVTGQIGNWVLSGGLHWQDGGAISSALGGQLSVRYSF